MNNISIGIKNIKNPKHSWSEGWTGRGGGQSLRCVEWNVRAGRDLGKEVAKGSARGMFVDYVITGQVGMTGFQR